MAMGKAIVATRLGAEGLNVNNGVDILLADTAADFAGQVTRALADEALTYRLGKSARKRAEEQYSWTGAVDRLERFYAELQLPVARFRSAHRIEAKAADRG
jgi:glycosyltransferase involved in cell wall biosynthesis